jgi:protein tyrosine/serine phosphatase
MLRVIFRLCALALALMAVYVGVMFATGNFRTVIQGQLYRSGQPTAEQIARWHERHGIKTIINLRGSHPDKEWYQAEREIAHRVGIDLIDYKLSAKREVTPSQLEELLAILKRARPPVLIHCRDGADRTGFISALYIAGVAGGSQLRAESQLTPLYGHIPLWFIPYSAMDRSFEKAEPRLGFPDS